MPLTRYQITNEYSLADPDLYKVADKDDPEALLEGVAMAGLVGVLRQLGDLAEFAAEIFHDLHEEVMSTAARGHSLIARVQQVEAEFPLVERTLLSQTSHTAFLYNTGIDWHSNARMDENVVTRGDLPRFVMDSYEECRGPPRLFLLDKFDVAGAGACLKRFTDPSFFKAEATSSTGKKSDGQRERKIRRVKKRGPRWRNEDTPETVLSSHAKLHELFLEELIETGGNDPDRRVKLKKRQFTGSLFDQEKTTSYMEKLLNACSPEQKTVHEVCIDALPLPWRSDDGCELGLEIVEIGTVSPLKESIYSSPDTRKMVVRPSLEGFSEGKFNDITNALALQDPRLNHDSDDGKISSAIYKVRGVEEFTDRESKSEVGAYDGGDSDDGASDIDNYMDALATIESEVETDSESKRTPRYLNWKPIVEDSDTSDGIREPLGLHLYARSFGNSTTSEDSNNFFKERQSSSCPVSANTLAETAPDLDAVVAAVPSTRASNTDADNVSFKHRSTSEEVPENKIEAGTMSPVDVETDEISKNVQELGDISGLSDPRDVYQTTSSFDGAVLDAPEETQSRDSSICSESLLNQITSHDCLLRTEMEKACSASSSVEEHSNDFRMADLSATSYPNVPEIVKPVDLCTPLTEENLDNHGQSETSPCQTPPRDCAAEALPSSQRYSSIKDVLTNVEGEEKAPSAPNVGQTEKFPLPISSGLQPCASESSFSGTDDAAEKPEHDSLEAAIVGVVSFGNLPNGEVLSRSSDGEMMGDSTMTRKPFPVLEHDFTETAKQYPESGTSDERKLVSSSGDEYKAALNLGAFERDDSIRQNVTSLYIDQTDLIETVEHLDKTETLVEVDAPSGHDCNNEHGDRNEAFSQDKFPVGPSKKLAYTASSTFGAQSDSDQSHDTGRLEHKEDAGGFPHENYLPSSSPSSVCLEKVQEKTSVTENYRQSEDELAEDVQSCGNFDAGEAPSTSENGIEYLESTTSHQVLLGGMEENVGSLSHDLLETVVPLEKGSHFLADEPQAKPLVANQQIQNPEYDHGQSSKPILSAQSAVHVPTQSEVESTSFFPGNDMFSSTNQATQMVENFGQCIESTPGFPVLGMLPAEPQINLDSPPLPPLPPMQWRMSRFQNSSATTARQLVQQHIRDPVQPMILLTNDDGTDTFTHTSNGASQPLAATICEVSSENSVDVIQRADVSLASRPTSTMSQNGTEISEESCRPSANLVEPESTAEGHTSGHDSSVKEAKADENDVQIQKELLEHISQITKQEVVNPHLQFLLSSPVHHDWQPPPGLIAPEARLTWSSAYDGIPTNTGAYANATQQKKLPRPRNPLIDEVVAIDKSKFRKVERVKPPVESKPEEKESFLEQLQLRKVERVKPPVESKAEERDSLLEHLQLRKVGERIEPHHPELNTEERESPLEHIRLRKVGERVKSEAEQQLEGTESPRVQLRKVGERVKSEIEQKPEETESPRVQLRKVNERVKPELEQKTEETESPQVQLRKVGETAPPPAAAKTEDKDSILEQIRNKTFSLKPAVATRPNIQGPRTNLQVAAILEKASNIRQAMAGSDEEEDDDADSWSDS